MEKVLNVVCMILMLCELSWEVVMMCLMRDENEMERGGDCYEG